MTTKKVAQLNYDGYYSGPVEAYESPLEPGVYHIPGGAVDAPLPDVPPGMRAKWVGGAWQMEDIPAPASSDIVTRPVASERDKTKADLVRLDQASIRALREAALGIPGAVARVQAWEDLAETLRRRIKTQNKEG